MKRDRRKRLLTVLLSLVGLTLILYAPIARWYNERVLVQEGERYLRQATDTGIDIWEGEREKARLFNEKLRNGQLHYVDPFSPTAEGQFRIEEEHYPEVFMTDEPVASVEIPKLSLQLPVYNGVSDRVLGKGVGYMSNTSLPVGGAGTHTVLTGHRGLASLELFRHLDRLVIGDLFFVTSLGQTLAYRVDRIETVLPNQADAIRIEPELDAMTLLTCTPYVLNTHRLLVRGLRIPYEKEAELTELIVTSQQERDWLIYWFRYREYAAAALLLGLAWWLLRRRRRSDESDNTSQKAA